MGWLRSLLEKGVGAAPTEWTLLDGLTDPGLNIAGNPMTPDGCYVEIYVESLRLEKARRFATTFNGVIYSFVSLARDGANRIDLAAVTKPQNLTALDANNLDRVISMSKRIAGAMPWRGDPFGLELGLFSVKSGNLLTPLINYVVKVSEKAGITAVTKIDPFTSLITEGLDIIAGQAGDTEIELAIDADLSLTKSKLCALIAKPKGTISASDLAIDRNDRKLLYQGAPLEAAYCVFSIRASDRNPDWGTIPALQQAYADFVKAVGSGRHKEAEEALAAFNRQVIVSPDLIPADKERLKAKAKADLIDAFPGGGQSADLGRQKFEGRQLIDLNLYGE